MDDLISRAEAMTELQMCAERYIFSHEADGFGTVEWCENLIPVRKAMEILRNLPTVDAVPVIRCKDCKWYYRGGATCMYWDGENGMRGDDYCSQAERKEE